MKEETPFSGRIITLTGLDRVGKESQVSLLQAALRPSVRMTFPEYGTHWAAEFVRATLNEEFITVHREGGQPLTFYPKKQPNIFQMWHSADRLDRQPWIAATLKTAHIVADRYEIDALAFGVVDGCAPEWLEAMAGLYRPSDLGIVMVGRPFPRPGEVPDLNERDSAFQQRVWEAYSAICTKRPQQTALLNVDDYRCADPISSKRWVHRQICATIEQRLGIAIRPLAYTEIHALEGARLGTR